MVKETDALRAVQPPLPRGDMAEMVERIAEQNQMRALIANPEVEIKEKEKPRGR